MEEATPRSPEATAAPTSETPLAADLAQAPVAQEPQTAQETQETQVAQENQETQDNPQDIKTAAIAPNEPSPAPSSAATPNPIAPSTHSTTGDFSDAERADLVAERDRLLAEVEQARRALAQTIVMGTTELEQRRQTLLASIEQLERRQERIRQEMKSTFAGASQNVAARVQGFKDYLVGSLQELVAAAEELPLRPPAPAAPPDRPAPAPAPTEAPPAIEGRFQTDRRKIEQLLDRYRTRPDYYGPPWRLRRTFEQVHADRVGQWFFELGGRGAVRTLGSRLQNILIVSAIVSVLRAMHGDRLRVLILIDSPERLGDWRRGLQDSLGISRADFGAEQGVMLFESPEPLAQRADRIQRNGGVPFIAIDESDGRISLSILQFPLWLAIAPDPRSIPPSSTANADYY
ncbi:MAG: DUF3086 domain-containing protein [Oscillatoriales cyanobacterium]|nr:MAG: DUF3086 domain-containing protein [Oscillatoriales cyanobacterium]